MENLKRCPSESLVGTIKTKSYKKEKDHRDAEKWVELLAKKEGGRRQKKNINYKSVLLKNIDIDNIIIE